MPTFYSMLSTVSNAFKLDYGVTPHSGERRISKCAEQTNMFTQNKTKQF